MSDPLAKSSNSNPPPLFETFVRNGLAAQKAVDQAAPSDQRKLGPRATLVAELGTVEGSIKTIIENPTFGTRLSQIDAQLLRETIDRVRVIADCLRGDAKEGGAR